MTLNLTLTLKNVWKACPCLFVLVVWQLQVWRRRQSAGTVPALSCPSWTSPRPPPSWSGTSPALTPATFSSLNWRSSRGQTSRFWRSLSSRTWTWWICPYSRVCMMREYIYVTRGFHFLLVGRFEIKTHKRLKWTLFNASSHLCFICFGWSFCYWFGGACFSCFVACFVLLVNSRFFVRVVFLGWLVCLFATWLVHFCFGIQNPVFLGGCCLLCYINEPKEQSVVILIESIYTEVVELNRGISFILSSETVSCQKDEFTVWIIMED